MKKETRIMFATLEGYSTEYLRKHKCVKPYHILAKQYDNESVIVEDITAEGFLKQLEELKGNTKVYFKNGGDLLQYLISPIYKLYPEKNISVSMGDTNNIYEIKISYKRRIDGKATKYTHKLIGVESIWPLQLEGMADSVEMDYIEADKYNFTDEFETIEDFKEFENGENYKANHNDVNILIAFAHKTWAIFPMEDYSQTLAATAMKMWRNSNPDDAKGIGVWMGYRENGDWKIDYDLWKTLKRAHKGGYVYVNPKYQLDVLENVCDYDINSMYSNTMKNEKLPYGYPNFNDDPEYTYKVYKVKIRNAVAKTVPFIATEYNTMDNLIAIQNSLNGTAEIIARDNEYKRHLKNMEVVMDNYTLELFEEMYEDLDYETEFVVNFQEKYGMFNRFLDELLELKENANGAERELIKGVLNSITGKFSQNIVDRKVQVLKEENLLDEIKISADGEKTYNGHRVSINDGIAFVKQNNGYKKNVSYIPLGMAITSKSKVRLIRDIHNNWDKFVYCDTDGFMTIGEAKGIEIDNNKIGKYKFQGRWNRVVVRRPKHYACEGLIEDKNGVKDVVEGYQLKGGGFQVKNFNGDNLPLTTYINPKFRVANGTMNKQIVKGGVVFWNSKFTFDMPKGWILEEYRKVEETKEEKEIIKEWVTKETREWDIIEQKWLVRTSKVLQERNNNE